MREDAEIINLFAPDLDKDFDTHLARLGFGVNPGGLHQQYRREALRLNTLSDFDLGLIGVKREDIPAFVMRHRFPLFAAQFVYHKANS